MEKVFSKNWKASKQPRKQRKYQANAPLHIKRGFLSANLSKELRDKHKPRNLPLRKNDVVKVMRGKFKGNKGKVLTVDPKELKIEVEGLQVQKKDGSKVNINMRPSNLQITELNEDDNKRIKSKTGKSSEKSSEKTSNKKQAKSKENKDSKTKSQSKKQGE